MNLLSYQHQTMPNHNDQGSSDSQNLDWIRSLIQKAEISEDYPLESYCIECDPNLAEKLLAINFENNRKKSPHTIWRYAKAMKQGQWNESTPLVISCDGKLIDGQHRLAAVIESKTTQVFHVLLGTSKRTGVYIDRGKRRTTADVCVIAGYNWVTSEHSSTARYMRFPSIGKYLIMSLTIDDLKDFIIKHEKALCFAVDSSKGKFSVPCGSRAVIARAYYKCQKEGKISRLQEFSKCLVSGFSNGEKDTAAIALRNALIKLKSIRHSNYSWGHDDQEKVFWLTESALNSFLNDQPKTQISPYRKDVFPIPEF